MSKRLTRDEALRRAAGCFARMEAAREVFGKCRSSEELIATGTALTAHATAARAYIAYADSLVFGGPEDGGDDD